MKLSKIVNWFKYNTIRCFHLDEWKDNINSKNFNSCDFISSAHIQPNNNTDIKCNDKRYIVDSDYIRNNRENIGDISQSFKYQRQTESSYYRKQPFFRWEDKYQKHSKDLVYALKTWAYSITFPFYEYVGGCLRKYPYSTTVNELDIPLLKQAKDHLEKSYPHILKLHSDIEKDCKRLCKEIEEIIKAKYKPSFEHTITLKYI